MTNPDHPTPEPATPPPDVMTRLELAAYLRISPRTLDTLIADGRAPASQALGSQRRWLRSAVDAWLAAGTKGADL